MLTFTDPSDYHITKLVKQSSEYSQILEKTKSMDFSQEEEKKEPVYMGSSGQTPNG